MELFVDSCDAGLVEAWLRCGVATGVTTNPILLSRCGPGSRLDLLAGLVAVAAPHPVSVQVDTAASEDAVVAAGERLAALGPNVVVKVPAVSPTGLPQLGAVHRLAAAGIPVNVTACLSAGQAILAAAAGATYVSLLCGRITDQGDDDVAALLTVRAWADAAPRPVRVLAASMRSAEHVLATLRGKPDVITVPPRILDALADHHASRTTAAEFLMSAGRTA